jgi:hypothetical protein
MIGEGPSHNPRSAQRDVLIRSEPAEKYAFFNEEE